MTNTTINYYNENAESFFQQTVSVDMSPLYDRFLAHIPNGGRILDAGCGSGRDAKVFLQRGFQVQAFDASESLAKKASEFLGQKVDCLRFSEIDYVDKFDGIWACASLLHVPTDELKTTLDKLTSLMREGSILYASFKKGTGERLVNGRHFTDMTAERLRHLINDSSQLTFLQMWETVDQRPDRNDEVWWNILSLKT